MLIFPHFLPEFEITLNLSKGSLKFSDRPEQNRIRCILKCITITYMVHTYLYQNLISTMPWGAALNGFVAESL